MNRSGHGMGLNPCAHQAIPRPPVVASISLCSVHGDSGSLHCWRRRLGLDSCHWERRRLNMRRDDWNPIVVQLPVTLPKLSIEIATPPKAEAAQNDHRNHQQELDGHEAQELGHQLWEKKAGLVNHLHALPVWRAAGNGISGHRTPGLCQAAVIPGGKLTPASPQASVMGSRHSIGIEPWQSRPGEGLQASILWTRRALVVIVLVVRGTLSLVHDICRDAKGLDIILQRQRIRNLPVRVRPGSWWSSCRAGPPGQRASQAEG